jgi:hypothetical protein
MTIRFLCPLGHPLAVPDNRAGKKGRCPVCRQRVCVPRPAGGASLSDDEVAELLTDPTADDEDDDSDEAPIDAEGDDEPVEAPPKASRRKPPPEAPSAAKGALASKLRPAGSATSKRKSGPPGTTRTADPPSDRHQWLSGLVGEWDYRMKLWLEPGGSPSAAIGEADAQWTMGERFVQIESQGTLLDTGFSSRLTLGYDHAKGAYTSCYLDNRSTGFFLAEGQADANGEALRLFGAMHGWQSSENNRPYLYMIGLAHHAQWTLELHDVLQGEKVMEIVYSRKK